MSPREEISAASLPRFRQRVGRATRWVVGMALSLSLLPLLGEAWADVLVVRGQAKPMVGTVVAEQEDRVTIAIKDAEGITREQIVPRDQILLIARAIGRMQTDLRMTTDLLDQLHKCRMAMIGGMIITTSTAHQEEDDRTVHLRAHFFHSLWKNGIRLGHHSPSGAPSLGHGLLP